MRYFPCFPHPEEDADLHVTPLATALTTGADYIARMAHHYGDHSPIIIREHYLTTQETFYYYEIARAAIPAFIDHYQRTAGLELERHRTLSERYFSDDSRAFRTFEYVHKLARNTYDHQAMAILQQHRVDPTGSGRIETLFERDGQAVPNIDAYTHSMVEKGYEVTLEAEWSLDYYGTFGRGADGLALSIGITPRRAAALVRSSQPLSTPPVPLCPLRQTVPAWLVGDVKSGG